MTTDVAPLSLSYQSFERLWKALVSKRKARKLNVDRELVWQQLRQLGAEAEFLLAPPKDARRRTMDGSQGAGDDTDALPARMSAEPATTAPSPRKGRAGTTPPKGGKAATRGVPAKRLTRKPPAPTPGKKGERAAGKGK